MSDEYPTRCPFCNSVNTCGVHIKDTHFAACNECHASGPVSDDPVMAIELWNAVTEVLDEVEREVGHGVT